MIRKSVGLSRSCVVFLLVLLPATLVAANLFKHSRTYSTGEGSSFKVTVADVNGDGKPDLLVANACPGCLGLVSACCSATATLHSTRAHI